MRSHLAKHPRHRSKNTHPKWCILIGSVTRVREIRNRYARTPEKSKFQVMNQKPDIRWKQRFQNFDRAFVLLRDALENGPETLNQLEKEGVIQRFEFSFELAWKTLKDFMEQDGFVFATITPRQVLKDAFVAKILPDGQVWIDMLDHRNLLSHTYDLAKSAEAIIAVHERYLDAFDQLHEFLQAEAMK
jgi:nucleotidyltransferase substrate binding protein (TIGR01987 family)